MALPDPASIDVEAAYTPGGDTMKEMIVMLTALIKMTNNNPNILALRTMNVCVGNVVMRSDFICTQPRAGL